MKTLQSPALVLLLATCAFVFGPVQLSRAAETTSAPVQPRESSRLVLKCSPVFPDYLGLVVRIDGQLAGAFTKGHVFKRNIAPGSHEIYVSERGHEITAFEGTLGVQPGRTYSYIVKWRVNEVILVPNRRSPAIAMR